MNVKLVTNAELVKQEAYTWKEYVSNPMASSLLPGKLLQTIFKCHVTGHCIKNTLAADGEFFIYVASGSASL